MRVGALVNKMTGFRHYVIISAVSIMLRLTITISLISSIGWRYFATTGLESPSVISRVWLRICNMRKPHSSAVCVYSRWGPASAWRGACSCLSGVSSTKKVTAFEPPSTTKCGALWTRIFVCDFSKVQLKIILITIGLLEIYVLKHNFKFPLAHLTNKNYIVDTHKVRYVTDTRIYVT